MHVKPKKHLGQHFLKDQSVAENLANALTGVGYKYVLEVGPGMGVLTQFLLQRDFETFVVEIDTESVVYLEEHFPALEKHIIPADYLQWNPQSIFGDEPFAVVGNYPYNISSQILFKVLEFRAQIPEMAGMFQKEVAMRIASGPGNKDYGILSVLTQAYYDVEYLFTVNEDVFIPPPRVKSGVIKLTRKANFELDCDEVLFKQVVKMAFNQRRKTLRNALKRLDLPQGLIAEETLALRAERLHWTEFVEMTKKIQQHGV
jgi:16S rRNA (adenine1518-N6/adenine1519-N6)-dimethyltransferase